MDKIKAVGYARRSTDMQTGSVYDQKAYVEKWAEANGYEVLRWYVDDAISGTSVRDREAFEKLIAQAENGRDFATILIYDMSRFSRGGTNETGYYLHRLRMAGVEVIFPAEGIPEGDEGELLQGVKSWQAKQYSVKLSKDCIRGQISSIMVRHSAPGGTPPYGYDKRHVTSDGRVLRTFRWLSDGRKEEYDGDGRLVRVLPPGESLKKTKSDVICYVPSTPDRVAVIKRIFEMYAAGYGSHYVVARLNEEGIPTADGRKWSAVHVRRMVSHPVYCGSLVWNKKSRGKLHSVGRDGSARPRKGLRVDRYNDRAEWFIVPNVHAPLVSQELFDEVQRQMESRRRLRGAAKSGNRGLLSGLIKCKRCGLSFGKRIGSASRDGKRKRYPYYMDRGYHTGGKAVCRLTILPMHAMDNWVIGKVSALLMGSSATVAEAVESFVHEILAAETKPTDTAAMEKDMDGLNRRIKAMVGMLADPSFEGLEELKATLGDLKVKRDALAKALADSQKTSVRLDASTLRDWANDRLGRLERLLGKESTIMEARDLIHSVVEKIIIDPDAKRGTLFIAADIASFFERSVSTLGTLSPTGRGESFSSDALGLQRTGHEFIDGVGGLAGVEDHVIDPLRQRHLHVPGVGEFDHALGRRHALDHPVDRGQRLLDGLPPPHRLAKGPVAADRREARRHEVAHARQARERLGLGTERAAQAADLDQAARQERRLGVVARLQPVEDARGDGDHVLGRPGQFDPQQIAVGVDPEVRAVQQPLDRRRQGRIGRRHRDGGRQLAGDLRGDRRA